MHMKLYAKTPPSVVADCQWKRFDEYATCWESRRAEIWSNPVRLCLVDDRDAGWLVCWTMVANVGKRYWCRAVPGQAQ